MQLAAGWAIPFGLISADEPTDPDIALEPAHVIVKPWRFHISPTKRQGVPGIECTAKGRLWVIHGRDVESTRNYQVLIAVFTEEEVRAGKPVSEKVRLRGEVARLPVEETPDPVQP